MWFSRPFSVGKPVNSRNARQRYRVRRTQKRHEKERGRPRAWPSSTSESEEESKNPKLPKSCGTFTQRVEKKWEVCPWPLPFARSQDWGGEDGGGAATGAVEGGEEEKRGGGRRVEADWGDSKEETRKGALAVFLMNWCPTLSLCRCLSLNKGFLLNRRGVAGTWKGSWLLRSIFGWRGRKRRNGRGKGERKSSEKWRRGEGRQQRLLSASVKGYYALKPPKQKNTRLEMSFSPLASVKAQTFSYL